MRLVAVPPHHLRAPAKCHDCFVAMSASRQSVRLDATFRRVFRRVARVSASQYTEAGRANVGHALVRHENSAVRVYEGLPCVPRPQQSHPWVSSTATARWWTSTTRSLWRVKALERVSSFRPVRGCDAWHSRTSPCPVHPGRSTYGLERLRSANVAPPDKGGKNEGGERLGQRGRV